jgi:T5SS/PEP-CTERM-associated repeat protein
MIQTPMFSHPHRLLAMTGMPALKAPLRRLPFTTAEGFIVTKIVNLASSVRKRCACMLGLSLLILSPWSNAQTISWTNSLGGDFSAQANWSPNGVPSVTDILLFTNDSAYTFTVDVNARNSGAFFHRGILTQAVSTTWILTNEWRVGEAPGSTSRVTAVSGLLAVTNATASALLSVGAAGTGELAIRGGRVVADVLRATNGSRSILTLGNGELTTLGSMVVSNAGGILVGSTPGDLFVWNAVNGTNRIITGQFDYGGLTLGSPSGGGRAQINLSGSNTVLSVPGLNTYGRNQIHITGGASFQTRQVQLGLQSGTSNLVLIADPGSSWNNEYLMYFGMHSGGQSLVISNGASFKTGGTQYSDQRFTAFSNPGNTILVTGSNSWFHSDGRANFGISWSSPVIPLNNLVLVTDGGRFWARNLTYGSTNLTLGSVSRPGNLIHVADGTLWIGSLTFAVGTLRVEAGHGTIDQLSMIGGTNAVLQVAGNLYVGHDGDLGPGDLRVGGATATLPALHGELQLQGWQLGVHAGNSGTIVMNGGQAFVTNASQTASLIVGAEGHGALHVNDALVQADSVVVGPNGIITATNGATLRIGNCAAPPSSILVQGATLELTSSSPLPSSAIEITDSVVSFRGRSDAPLELNDPDYLGRLRVSGRIALQLIDTVSAPAPLLVFRDHEDASAWSRLIFNGGASILQADAILIETNSALVATNSVATITGSFTNQGRLILQNSRLEFAGPVVLTATSSLQGHEGFVLFKGGLHLPATDIVVPAGMAVQARSITSEGGKLILEGGRVIPNEDGTIPDGFIFSHQGWITYVDTESVPLTPPSGPAGGLGLELIRSTNAPVHSQTFAGGIGRYERLRLAAGSHWESEELLLGQGGGMFLADPSATITLGSGVFRVEDGAFFRDDTGGASHVGFNAGSSNANATVSGSGSTWLASGGISVGAAGSQNRLLVESGGQLLADAAVIGGTGGHRNRLTLSGTGASCLATNGLTMAGNENEFFILSGGVFTGSQILASGTRALVSIIGTGAVANCSTRLRLSGSGSRLQVFDGANLFTSNGVLNGSSGSLAEIAGEGSLWKLDGDLSLVPTFSSSFVNQLVLRDQGVLASPSVIVNSSTSGRAALTVQSGRLFVTNALGTATLRVNGPLELNGGLLRADTLIATNANLSVLNHRAGRAEWASCDVAAGVALQIGDSTHLASLRLLGGTNLCRSGLEIRRHAKMLGTGVIIGGVTNRGSLWPSRILIESNLVLGADSELSFTLAANPDSTGSFLEVTGDAILDGTLRISLAPGSTPSGAHTFILLESPGISSRFSNVNFGERLLTADGLASFQIDNTGTSIVATGFQSEDLDGDGIQDAWAMRHFGFSPLPPGTGAAELDGDWDGDGLSNRDEFLLGTDPTDSSSGFFVQLNSTGEGGIQLRFPYFPDRLYYVNVSSDLLGWSETLIEIISFDESGLAVWTDAIAPATGWRFFRFRIE